MRLLKIAASNIVVMLVLLGLLEAVGQVVSIADPSYEVLFLQPDRKTGWKHVPNFAWNWTGHYWYAADFNVRVRSNRFGFRDHAPAVAKPRGVKRVALLGNSFIEALQVPHYQTADYLVEQRLNANLRDSAGRTRRWEVLNFGISNYGIGQYLLTWQGYAAQYKPDYVMAFVAFFHMKRTVRKYTSGAFRYSQGRQLWVRPVFEINEYDSLVVVPAQDFEEFRAMQEEVIREEFDGKRFRKRRRLVTVHYLREILNRLQEAGEGFYQRYVGDVPVKDSDEIPGIDDEWDVDEIVELNLRILSELGKQVADAGGKLVILDASQYFGDDPSISDELSRFASTGGYGYVPVYTHLIEADRKGLAIRWAHDGHFNERGNQIVANAVYDWVARDVTAPISTTTSSK